MKMIFLDPKRKAWFQSDKFLSQPKKHHHLPSKLLKRWAWHLGHVHSDTGAKIATFH